jgi:AcrR family transcriptional regulator
MDKREQVILKAMELFVKQGFENTPTSQISKEAGVATGTLFHHFKSKEDLVNEVYLYIKKKLIKETIEKVDSEDSVKASLEKLWTESINWAMRENIEYDYAMKYNSSIYVTDEVTEIVAQEFAVFEKVVKRGFKEKIFRKITSELIWSMFGSMSLGIVNHLNSINKKDTKIIKEGFEMFWKAVT